MQENPPQDSPFDTPNVDPIPAVNNSSQGSHNDGKSSQDSAAMTKDAEEPAVPSSPTRITMPVVEEDKENSIGADLNKENVPVKKVSKRKKVKETPAAQLTADVVAEHIDGPPLDAGSPEVKEHRRPHLPRLADAESLRLIVKIGDMSPITSNPDIVHPLVRFCVVDGATGEALETYTTDQGVMRPRYHLTLPFDLRRRSSTQPVWEHEAEFCVPRDLDNYPRATLLFELLDFGSENIRGESDVDRGIFPICWGFLCLRNGDGDSNAKRNLRLQLFRSPERRWWLTSVAVFIGSLFAPTPQAMVQVPLTRSSSPSIVPELFEVFRDPKNRNDIYPATLGVSFFYVTPPQHYEVATPESTPYEEYLLRLFEAAMYKRALDRGFLPVKERELQTKPKTSRQLKNQEEAKARHAELLASDFSRRSAMGERCLPPNTVMHTLPIDGIVSAMSFAPQSSLLAVAVTSDFHGSVFLYDVHNASRPLISVLRGHVGHIHDVRFNREGSRILTASSDRTVRLWNIESLSLFVTSGDDDHKTCEHTLVHPMQVYSASFLEKKYVVTAGFDFNLRVWSWTSGKLAGLACVTSTVPTFFKQLHSFGADSERLWALDALGTLSIWRVNEDPTTNEFISLKSVTQSIKVPGAVRVTLVAGQLAAFTCIDKKSRSIAVLETSSQRIVRRIIIPQNRSTELAAMLLPDAKLIVVPLTASKIQLFDPQSGDLMTPETGLGLVRSEAEVTHVAWCDAEHVCAVSTESSQGRSAAVHILGRPRIPREEIFEHDKNSTELLRQMCGGAPVEVERGGAAAKFLNHQATPRDVSGAARRESRSGPLDRRTEARSIDEPAFRYEGGNARATIDRILSYWGDLVGKAGSTKKESAKEPIDSHPL